MSFVRGGAKMLQRFSMAFLVKSQNAVPEDLLDVLVIFSRAIGARLADIRGLDIVWFLPYNTTMLEGLTLHDNGIPIYVQLRVSSLAALVGRGSFSWQAGPAPCPPCARSRWP